MNDNSNKKPKLNTNRIRLVIQIVNNHLIYYSAYPSTKNNTIIHYNEFIKGEDSPKIVKLRYKRYTHIA